MSEEEKQRLHRRESVYKPKVRKVAKDQIFEEAAGEEEGRGAQRREVLISGREESLGGTEKLWNVREENLSI